MKALGRLRQFAVGGWPDLGSSVARRLTEGWIIMADVWDRADTTSAIYRGLDMDILAQPEIAFDDRVGGIDAVDDDGNARPARDDAIEAAPGKSRGCRAGQKGQCDHTAHRNPASLAHRQPTPTRATRGKDG